MGRAVKDVGFTEKGGNQEELGGRGLGGFHQVRGYNTLIFLEILLVPHGGCPRKEERRVEVGD